MGSKILHRPGLIRPLGSQGQSRIFGPIGSIPQSIADTRNIIVVKLIKPVIANPTDRKEGLRPVWSPKSFSEAPSPSTISFYVNSEYNSSEIDKIRYCPPDRWRDKNNFLGRLECIWKRHPVKKRLWPCPEGDRPGRWSFFAGCLLIIVLAAD